MWFRVIMLLAMIKGDNIEGALSNIGYVMLSSSLHSGFQLVQGKIMLPKLVKMGKVHPEALRKAKFPMRRMLWHFFVASFVAYLLVQSGSKRLTWFLLVTTGVFPIFRCFAFPKMWPIPAFMCLVMYFVWRNEGVQELFLGLLLFQAVPVMQEIMTFYLQPVVGRRLARVGAFAAWLTAFAMCVPIAGTFLWAMFDSKSFDRFVRRRNRKEYNGYWRKYEWFQGILGFVDDSGENPFQVLGVSQSATAAQIRKRFRDLSVKYHPDKTGNDPVKSAYFVKLQRAMEAITSGTADGKVNENALMERVSGTIHRCAELTPVIGMWLALSIWGAFVEFMQNRGKRKSKRRKGRKKKSKKKSKSEKKSDKTDDGKENTNNGVESTHPTTNVEEKKEEYRTFPSSSSDDDDDNGEGESSSGDEEDEDGDEEEEDVLPNVGPSFVGASVLSDIYGGQRRRPSAKGRASAGLRTSEPRTVGGRRIQTPIVMPHRGKDAVTNNTTKVNTDDDGKKSDDKKKEN